MLDATDRDTQLQAQRQSRIPHAKTPAIGSAGALDSVFNFEVCTASTVTGNGALMSRGVGNPCAWTTRRPLLGGLRSAFLLFYFCVDISLLLLVCSEKSPQREMLDRAIIFQAVLGIFRGVINDARLALNCSLPLII